MANRTSLNAVLLFLVALLSATRIHGFTAPYLHSASRTSRSTATTTTTTTTTTTPTAIFMSQQQEKPEYSRELLLREEAESPFRKVRFFFYISLAGGAATSLAVSVARIAAGLAGINADLLNESLTNAGVDVGGLAVLAFLYLRDLKAQEARLKQAFKGAALAKLTIRGSKSIITGLDAASEASEDSEMFTTTLASLRRGRGIEKRVVITAGGKDKIAEIIKEAVKLQDRIEMSDLLIVPVIMPQGVAPDLSGMDMPSCVALPVGNNWKFVVDDEAEEAVNQGVDIEKEGFCVILKKNGRVGQRTRGVFLERMVGEVEYMGDGPG
jgi:hypothetical protein